jgi:Ca-activated chloride channel family protein
VKPSIRLEHALVAVEAEHDVNVMLELTAPAPDPSRTRPPIAVALVLDRSGSMDGAPLETAKRAAAWLVERLAPTDLVSVVTFDNEVDLVSPPVAPGPGLVAAIESIQSGGMTNLSGGWLKGREVLAGLDPTMPRTLLLLTDGHANEGITDRAQLVALANKASAGRITTTTIGFGGGFDEDLLLAMADAGRGNAHYAATVEALPGIFAKEVEGLTQLVAQNVSVELRPANSVEVVTIWNDHPTTPVAGGLQIALGDAYAGDVRRLVFALRVPHVVTLGPASVADCVLRYAAVGDIVQQHTVTIPIVVNVVSASEAAAQAPDLVVHEEVQLLAAARARDEAVKRADAGDTPGAAAYLRSFASDLVAGSPSPRLQGEASAMESAADEIDAMGFDAGTRKGLRYDANKSRRSRGD